MMLGSKIMPYSSLFGQLFSRDGKMGSAQSIVKVPDQFNQGSYQEIKISNKGGSIKSSSYGITIDTSDSDK